jgi:hypothetical protein
MINFTLETYPDIRDLTRKLSQDIQSRLCGHLETVKSHFRPGSVFGSHVSSGSKSSGPENSRNAEVAFAQLTESYRQIAASPALNLDATLPNVLDINFATPVLSPLVYPHQIATAAGTRRLTVTAPFRLVLAFPEYSFNDLRNLINGRGSKEKLFGFVLHYMVLNYLTMQNKRLLSLFEDLRFPIRSVCVAELGALPITTIEAPAGSVRPPDAFMAQVAKFSGSDNAEELVDFEAWDKLADPLLTWFRDEAAKFPEAAGAVRPPEP